MQDFAITKVYINDKDKAGKPFLTKEGKPYKKIAIKVDYADYDGKYISSLVFKEDDPKLQIKEGERRKLIVTHNGDYLNFELPSRADLIEERLTAIENLLRNFQPNSKSRGTENVPVIKLDQEVEQGSDETPF